MKLKQKLIRSIQRLKPQQQGNVLTVGNFDGVHVGHQQLIKQTIEKARVAQLHSMALTFEPHPFQYFKRGAIPRLTRFREKFCALADLGLDHILFLRFNEKLAQCTAQQFVDEIIIKKLQPKSILIGEDFRFGHQRQGDFAFLAARCRAVGIEVNAMEAVQVGGERVSSTRVRAALAQGDHPLVARLLGHPYTMKGRVVGGDQRGRQWGFPTANIHLDRDLTPVWGVYTAYMHGITSQPWPGVANVGVRPTVDGMRCLLEVHLFDFNQDIYGKHVEIEFCTKLRDEIRFADISLLKTQIADDVLMARHYFQLKNR